MNKKAVALVVAIIGLVILGSVSMKMALGVVLFVAAHRIAEHE